MPRRAAVGRTAAFRQDEIDKMLDLVQLHLPSGADQWEIVGNAFRAHFNGALLPRETESLKLKFKKMRLVKKPTGDPLCPPDVKRAKRIWREIEINNEVIGGGNDDDDDDDDDLGVDGDNDDDDERDPEAEFDGEEDVVVNSVSAVLPPAVRSATPARSSTSSVHGRSSSASSSSASSSGGRPSSGGAQSSFRTTQRTGYSEPELFAATASLNPVTRKRNMLDSQIGSVSGSQSDPLMQMMMMQNARQDERREELRREERREREQQRRDDEERRQNHEEHQRQQRKDDQQQMLMLLAAVFGAKPSNNT